MPPAVQGVETSSQPKPVGNRRQDPLLGRAGASFSVAGSGLVGLRLIEKQDEDNADQAEYTHEEHSQA
jgi:hypothetical protein